MADDDLLAAIAENPDDDAPRLVYADVLSQRGDPWGELIVAACELALYYDNKRPWDARAHTLESRVTALQRDRFPDVSGYWSRGFCNDIAMPARLEDLDEPVFAALGSLRLETATSEQLDNLATWPRLATLRELSMRGQGTPARDAAAIRCVAAAKNLTALSYTQMHATPDDQVALFDAIAPQLRKLWVEGLEVAAVPRLRWPALEELSIQTSELTDQELATILSSSAIQALKLFRLYSYRETLTFQPIARCPWTRLATLGLHDLDSSELIPAMIPAIAALPITSLEVDNDPGIFTDAFPHFARFPALTTLSFESDRPGPGLPAIARAYESLELQICDPDMDELEALLCHPALASCKTLRISMIGRADEAPSLGTRLATAIAKASLPRLEELMLSDCRLGEEGGKILAAANLPDNVRGHLYKDDGARSVLASRFPYFGDL